MFCYFFKLLLFVCFLKRHYNWSQTGELLAILQLQTLNIQACDEKWQGGCSVQCKQVALESDQSP